MELIYRVELGIVYYHRVIFVVSSERPKWCYQGNIAATHYQLHIYYNLFKREFKKTLIDLSFFVNWKLFQTHQHIRHITIVIDYSIRIDK